MSKHFFFFRHQVEKIHLAVSLNHQNRNHSRQRFEALNLLNGSSLSTPRWYRSVLKTQWKCWTPRLWCSRILNCLFMPKRPEFGNVTLLQYSIMYSTSTAWSPVSNTPSICAIKRDQCKKMQGTKRSSPVLRQWNYAFEISSFSFSTIIRLKGWEFDPFAVWTSNFGWHFEYEKLRLSNFHTTSINKRRKTNGTKTTTSSAKDVKQTALKQLHVRLSLSNQNYTEQTQQT